MIFDVSNLGWVNLSDLKQGLSSIGVYASYDEIDLYFKRYDTNKDSRIRYNEFCDSLIPDDSYYASMVNRRSSNHIYLKYEPRDSCFAYSTRIQFKETWRTLLRVEVQAERLR
jgi:hypothetical protein